MTRTEFNIAIAKRVMGWVTALDESSYSDTGYTYTEAAGDVILGRDFTRDHNAAALVRERIFALGRQCAFVDHVCLTEIDGEDYVELSIARVWQILNLPPEQTARAAYRAVTGEEMEAIDE